MNLKEKEDEKKDKNVIMSTLVMKKHEKYIGSLPNYDPKFLPSFNSHTQQIFSSGESASALESLVAHDNLLK